MRKIVVLIRHGKAKDRAASTDMPDRERPLTHAGKRALAAWLPRALEQEELARCASAELWASPAVRTVQTAEAVRSAWGSRMSAPVPPVQMRSFLLDQDFDAFAAAVRTTPAEAIFVVGHNPFIEEACTRLTGNRIRFSTGAACALELPSPDGAAVGAHDAGRMLWFLQGPDSKRWKVLVDLERTIAAGGDDVIARRDAFFADPSDVETLHKLRTSIRAQRSLLAFARPFLSRSRERALQRDLRALVLVTSRLREIDVLRAQAAELDPPATALIEACDRLRSETCAQVIEQLSSQTARKRFDRAHHASHHLVWKKSVERAGLDADAVPRRLASLADETDAALASLDLCDPERTHHVRKQAKRVRYASERFAKLAGEDAPEIAARMKAAQDRLGSLCDARANIGIIESFPTEGLVEEAQWDLSLLNTRNLELLYTTLRRASADTPDAPADRACAEPREICGGNGGGARKTGNEPDDSLPAADDRPAHPAHAIVDPFGPERNPRLV